MKVEDLEQRPGAPAGVDAALERFGEKASILIQAARFSANRSS